MRRREESLKNNAHNNENKFSKGGITMEFQTEAWERYSDSQNRAKRIVRRGADVTLPVLESILDKTKVAGEVDLQLFT